MNSRIDWLLHDWRRAPLVGGCVVLVTLSTFYWISGNFSADPPWYLSSKEEFLGMTLLLILAPSYVIAGMLFAMRRSLELARDIDASNSTQLVNELKQYSARSIGFFALLGWVYAVLFNIPDNGLNLWHMNRVERAMVFGQMLIWTLLGVLLAVRIHVSHAFNRASHQVAVSIFETSNLKPFAMIGLVDVLLVAGGMVLSTVQSLDFSFRPGNYTNLLVVAVPAMLFLAIYPMWPLHRRMSAYRACQLHEVNERIRGVSDSLQSEHMEQLEILLQRRERVLAASTWPMDVDTLRRFVFYIIIPPLAWVGAAMVESLLEGFLRK